MDEVLSRAALPRDTLRALSARTDGPGLVRTTAHLGALATLFGLWLAVPDAPLVTAFVLVLGSALFGLLFGPLHETCHHTAFRTRALNQALYALTAVLHLFSPTSYRAFHWEHHRHTHEPDRDPEIQPAPHLLGAWPRSTLVHLLAVTGLHLVVLKLLLLIGEASQLRFVAERFLPWLPADRRARVAWEARGVLLVWGGVIAAAVAGWPGADLLLAWQVLGHTFLAPLLMAEHHGLPHEGDIIARTRSIPTVAPLRWFFWNMPYHAEHHGWPSVPFHALPALHREVAPLLPHRSLGYLAIHLAARRARR